MGDKLTLSTGNAARLCGVKPDTILKWIKSSKINAKRTAGGHYRITKETLSDYIAGNERFQSKQKKSLSQICNGNLVRCWEFWAKENNRLQENCLECIVFRSKAEFCHVIKKQVEQAENSAVLCGKKCKECSYYNYLKSRRKIIVITEDESFREKIIDITSGVAEVHFACCSYSFLKILNKFIPGVIIIDKRNQKNSSEALFLQVTNDPRVSESQIYFAINDYEGVGVKAEGKDRLGEKSCITLTSEPLL